MNTNDIQFFQEGENGENSLAQDSSNIENVVNIYANDRNDRPIDKSNNNHSNTEQRRETTAHTTFFETEKKSKGRRPKSSKRIIKVQHDSKAPDNTRRKVFTLFAKSLDEHIHYYAYVYDVKVHPLHIKSQLGITLRQYKKFFKKTIYEIYCDKNDEKKKKIDKLLQKESESGDYFLVLDFLFSLKFETLFRRFLMDKPYLNIEKAKDNKKLIVCFYKFKTLRDAPLDEEDKKRYKKIGLDFLDNKVTPRRRRRKRR